MNFSAKSIRIIECVVMLLTCTVISGLVGKGIHFLYYGVGKDQHFNNQSFKSKKIYTKK